MVPKVSVIMAAYNADRIHLNLSVRSILNQSFKDFELIIIDDYSTMYKVAEYIRPNFRDNRIRVFRNSKNLGLTKSLNIGIREARSNLIARMDSDDISVSTRLEFQLRYLKKYPTISILGTKALIINNKGQVLRVKNRVIDNDSICFYLFINNPYIHSSVMFYKDCFDDVGGYNESYQFAQDYELWSRFHLKYKGANIDKPLVKWRDNKQGVSAQNSKEQTSLADKTSLKYFRKVLSMTKEIPDNILLSIRYARFGRGNNKTREAVVREMYEHFNCTYSRKWYKNFLNRTKDFR